ncbi:MAG: hypothetical protein KGI50_07695 [Patescibacteria group bacterium]|nr:hypothetical protein [Patescibacteria group bacterium]
MTNLKAKPEKLSGGIANLKRGHNRKGQPNKNTAQLKDMILKALDGAGGSDYLLDRANDPKTQGAFLQLIGKVLPMTIAGDANKPLVFSLSTPWLSKAIAERNGD